MGKAVDTFAELTRLHSEQDDTSRILFDRHSTTYANGERIVEYEFSVIENGDMSCIMLTQAQMKALCNEMMQEWTKEAA